MSRERSDPNEDLLLAGEIGKPHGIKGEVCVVVISDDPTRFEPGAQLIHDDGRVLTIEAAREHRGRLLVKFQGIDTRNEAEDLRGAVFVPAGTVRQLDEGEFWERDLVGSQVVTSDGADVGELVDIVPGPAQDLLVVETERGERMVPFVTEIVVAVDASARRIVIDPPEGLLD